MKKTLSRNELVRTAISGSTTDDKLAALDELFARGEAIYLPEVWELLGDPDYRVRKAATWPHIEWREPRDYYLAAQVLDALRGDDHPEVRRVAGGFIAREMREIREWVLNAGEPGDWRYRRAFEDQATLERVRSIVSEWDV